MTTGTGRFVIIYDWLNANPNKKDEIKRSGKSALDGEAPAQYEIVEDINRAAGLFVVPVGEIECFGKTINKEKKDWVYEIIERGLLNELSEYLNGRFGKGFSVATLKNARKFYQTYSPSLSGRPPAKLTDSNGQTVFSEFYPFKLGWSHYLILMRIKNEQERRFYEIEAARQQWTVRQLSRQYNSSLYERLALSRNKDEVMRLANEGQMIEKPRDVLKNPLVLEFIGLDDKIICCECACHR